MSRKKENNKTFGSRLKIAMGDMSVYALAKTTGLSHTAFRRYLNDETVPDIINAQKIAKTLKVSFSWLSIGEGTMKPSDNKKLDILAPENLKKMSVDLYTVVTAAEDLIKKAKKEENLSAKTIAHDIALRCMSVPD